VERNGYAHRWPRPKRVSSRCYAPHRALAHIRRVQAAISLYKQDGLFLLSGQSKVINDGASTASGSGSRRETEIVDQGRKYRDCWCGPGWWPRRGGLAREGLSGRDHDARRRAPPALRTAAAIQGNASRAGYAGHLHQAGQGLARRVEGPARNRRHRGRLRYRSPYRLDRGWPLICV